MSSGVIFYAAHSKACRFMNVVTYHVADLGKALRRAGLREGFFRPLLQGPEAGELAAGLDSLLRTCALVEREGRQFMSALHLENDRRRGPWRPAPKPSNLAGAYRRLSDEMERMHSELRRILSAAIAEADSIDCTSHALLTGKARAVFANGTVRVESVSPVIQATCQAERPFRGTGKFSRDAKFIRDEPGCVTDSSRAPGHFVHKEQP